MQTIQKVVMRHDRSCTLPLEWVAWKKDAWNAVINPLPPRPDPRKSDLLIDTQSDTIQESECNLWDRALLNAVGMLKQSRVK